MKKHYDDDDGRVIANMNVEGMPWYRRESSLSDSHGSELDRADTRKVIWGVMKVTFAFLAVFSAIMVLVVFIMTRIWS